MHQHNRTAVERFPSHLGQPCTSDFIRLFWPIIFSTFRDCFTAPSQSHSSEQNMYHMLTWYHTFVSHRNDLIEGRTDTVYPRTIYGRTEIRGENDHGYQILQKRWTLT
ncbi:hypothetical protein CSKR_200937, partial [Clonorchis sinensis]